MSNLTESIGFETSRKDWQLCDQGFEGFCLFVQMRQDPAWLFGQLVSGNGNEISVTGI